MYCDECMTVCPRCEGTYQYLQEERDKLRAENERLRRFVSSLAKSPADALDVEMIVAAASTVLATESEGDPRG